MPRYFWLGLTLLLLTACRPVDALPPTATTLRVVQATVPPGTLPASPERDLRAIAAQTPESTPEAENCQISAALPTTEHTVSADIHYEQHEAQVEQHTHTINRSSESLTDVVFDVEANRFPAIFTLSSVEANLGVSSY
ncbi:MAG: hypothetical protein ABI700_33690, partial [Chloroflexota bacterium]